MKDHGRADPHPAAHARASSWQEPWPVKKKEPRQEQVSCQPCSLWVIQAGAVLNGCILWKRPTLRVFVKDCLPWVGPHIGAEKENQEEGAVETKYPFVPLWDGRVKNEGETFKQGQWGQDAFSFVFTSHYSTTSSQVTFLKSSLLGL